MAKFAKYSNELDRLIHDGELLLGNISMECLSGDEKSEFLRKNQHMLKDYIEYGNFRSKYQPWYSESKSLVKQVLPDRLDDFVRLYEKQQKRERNDYSNYRIEDYLQEASVVRTFLIQELLTAVRLFQQQLGIVNAIKNKFESSLSGIRMLLQADLFDSELLAAKELLDSGFFRAAGVVAGVVLEKHLKEVCDNHGIEVKIKNPSISSLNELLKDKVLETKDWRFILRLADIRNICGHDASSEPTPDEVAELIKGIDKICKTLF